MNRHILEVDSVRLSFGGKVILSDVYLQCETGKVAALIGRNGTGKSCLMQIAFGMRKAGQGTIRIDGQTVQRNNMSRYLSYLPQFSFIPGNISIRQVFRDFDLSPELFEQHFPGLVRLHDAKVSSLPGGERRVLEVYAVLNSPAPFSFLDEPFTHIMPLHVTRLQTVIREVRARKGLLIADHRHEDLRPVTDTLYLLEDGFLKRAERCTLKRDPENI